MQCELKNLNKQLALAREEFAHKMQDKISDYDFEKMNLTRGEYMDEMRVFRFVEDGGKMHGDDVHPFT